MKVFSINIFNPTFQGKRKDRNAVSQLENENYDLNVPNQRRINNAISNLSKISDEDNINFLLNVANNLKYGTNIDLDGKKSYNDWQTKLEEATKSALSKSDKSVQERLLPKVNESFNTKKPLTNEEKEILATRKELLDKVDFKFLEHYPEQNIKNVKRNLDYFIISSEVPTSQKLYILKRLNHFMSPEYKINPQLKDKKTQALAEMVNDIVVNTPESKIPNTKAINQKGHGICAAISVCRKFLAYEDKRNYVDMVMSELDDKDYMEVYDITKLGSNTKVPIKKCNIDFDYALEKNYRIVDASAMYWMNIADTAGSTNEAVGHYSSFDKTNFDTFNDAHINADLPPELASHQNYYRSLLIAKKNLLSCKKDKIKIHYIAQNRGNRIQNSIHNAMINNQYLKDILTKIAPKASDKELRMITNNLISLSVDNSSERDKINDYRKDFLYIPNESTNAKLEKIKAFLSIAISERPNTEALNKFAPEVLSLTNEIKNANPTHQSSPIRKAQNLYRAAAAYRTKAEFELNVPEYQAELATNLKLSDNETLILENMDSLINKLKKGKINPELRKRLSENFESPNTTQDLVATLESHRENINYLLTDLLDNYYTATLAENRKGGLGNDLIQLKSYVESSEEPLDQIAKLLDTQNNKNAIIQRINEHLATLESEETTEEEYLELYKKLGHRSHLEDFKNSFENLGKFIFEDGNEDVVRAFNLLNGGKENLSAEETINLYNNIATSFNNVAELIERYRNALNITDENNNILNTVEPKEIILKKLENEGEVISRKDLQILHDKFLKISKVRAEHEFTGFRQKKLPKELTTLTAQEKEILKKIDRNINAWYSTTTRELSDEYLNLKEPLEEMHKEIGLIKGNTCVPASGTSGLYDSQTIKILEHMTDRPYYSEKDGLKVIKKIKNSPHSGISATSVSDTEAAMHAQYIVDVKPTVLKVGNKLVTKDVIYHDNTWGAVEHNNTWIDENGLYRTDYEGGYGGSNGYIIDKNYRTGKIAENIINKEGKYIPRNNINSKNYKKLVKGGSYTFPLYESSRIEGYTPLAKSYTKMIKENMLFSPSEYLDDLEKYSQNMTQKEILSHINQINSVGDYARKRYFKYLQQIKGDKLLNNGINTKEKYDKLPNSNELKIALEKLAIKMSYPSEELNKLYEIKDIKEFEKIKENIKKEARKNFNYIFAKDIDIVKYGATSVNTSLLKMLNDFSKDNKVKLSKDDKTVILNSLKHINSKDFDGSLNHTIELMVSNFEKTLDKKIPDIEYKQEEIKILANKVKTLLETNMGFTLADLNSSSSKNENFERIIDFIDNTFDPSTDEEFVQIFKTIQNMSKQEFDKKFNSEITNSLLGIKELDGSKLLQKLSIDDKNTKNALFNLLYYEELHKNTEVSKTTPIYHFDKLERKYYGGQYIKKVRSFDDIYSEYYYSLKLLTEEKENKKYAKEIFDKYKLFLAIPSIETTSVEKNKKVISTFTQSMIEEISRVNDYKKLDKSFNLLDNLKQEISTLKGLKDLTPRQQQIITEGLREFAEINEGDESITEILERITSILDSETNKTSEYESLIDFMWKNLNPYRTIEDGKTYKDLILLSLKQIKEAKNSFVKSVIDPKYQREANEYLNKWITLKSKELELKDDSIEQINKMNEAETYYYKFIYIFDKHNQVETPDKMLKDFLLMNAKDAKIVDKNISKNKESEEIKKFNDLKDSYKIQIKGLLHCANLLELQTTIMNIADEGNLNAVAHALSTEKIKLLDGSEIPMDSDEGLSIILNPMLADDNFSTAIMFINQLGLGEKVTNMLLKNNPIQQGYENINNIHKILEKLSKQTEFVEQEFKKLQYLDTDAKYEEQIMNFKNTIFKKITKAEYREIYEKGINNAIETMQKNPEIRKTEILKENLLSAKLGTIYTAKEEIDILNQELQQLQNTHKLISQIKLPVNSPMEEVRNKYFEEFEKLGQYNVSKAKNYENIGLST